jgi:hypothetical protein
MLRIFFLTSYYPDFDTFGHLYYSKELKNQNLSIFDPIKIQSINSKAYYHPFFWHYVISKLGVSYILRFQKFINPFLDFIFLLFMIFAFQIYFNDIKLVFLFCFIYFFTPQLFSNLSLGPRIRSLSPRLFSEILINVLILILFNVFNLSLFLQFFLFFIINTLVLTSSKFGTQVLLFILIPFSLLTLNFYFLASILFSFSFLLLISKKKFLNILLSQYEHLNWYFKANSLNKMQVSSRIEFFSYFRNVNFSFKSYARIFLILITKHPLISLIFKFPLIVFLFFSLLFNIKNDFLGVDFDLILFFSIVLIVFIITSFKFFLFLGESERYLTHCFTIFILILGHLNFNILYVYFLCIYGIVFFLLEIIIIHPRNFSKVNLDSEINCLYKLIPNGSKIVTYPFHTLGIYRIMFETKLLPFFPVFLNDSDLSVYEKSFSEKYPYFNLSLLNEFSNFFNIKYLIINRNSIPIDYKFPNNWEFIAVPLKLNMLLLKNNNVD